MKKLTALCIAAFGLASSVAIAQTVKEYPAHLPEVSTKAMEKSPQRAPLNTEKPLGVKIFSGLAYDYDVAKHYVTLYSKQPGKLNKLNTILFPGTSDENVPTLHKINAGAWGGDGYYAYKAAYYSTGSTHLDCWIKVDPETGNAEILKDLVGLWYPKNWEYIYDLSYNYRDNKFYGLAYGTKANEYDAMTSQILVIDKETGANLGTAKELDEYYFCMAFNYDGELYAIRWTYNADAEITGAQLDVFDTDFDKIKSTPLYVDGEKLKIYFENSLEFDHTTGDLYWGSVDLDQRSRLIKIDPATAVTENLGTIGYNEILKGPYIPFNTADSRTAPARVDNMSFTIDAQGNNAVTISWTNPSTQWNRKALSDLKEVQIWRDNYDGEPVATLDASGKVGANMSWTDDKAAKGVHTYYVVPFAKAGEKGVMNSVEAYVGRDVAGPVQNLVATATADGKGVNLTWSAPVTGDSNGWFDASSLSYKVTRLPDNKQFEGTLTTTSFSDLDIPEAQAYSYIVTPITSDGEGTPVTSNQVIAGRSILPPFACDFNNQSDAERFTVIDANGDGSMFSWGSNNNKACKSMVLINSNGDNDDLLVSPPLSLKKGKTYRIKYNASFGGFGYNNRQMHHQMRLVGGTEATKDGLSTVHQILDFDTYELYADKVIDGYVESPVDGDYYIALEVLTSNETDMWTYIETFEITELSYIDLSVENFKTYLNLSNLENNVFEVEVFNHGKVAAKDYKVQVACLNYLGEPVVFAEATEVPEIAPRSNAKVVVNGYPDRVGEAKVVGLVKMSGDTNADNDMSEPVNVNIDEYYAFNHSVTGDKLCEDPNIPMTHYNNVSVTQTIYTPELTKLPTDGTATIRRIAWEYDGKDEFDGTEYDVYLTQTSQKGYGLSDRFVNVYDEPLYSGSFKAMKGVNYLLADLEEEFVYDLSKNLMVTVVKKEDAHSDWLLYFKAIDLPWDDNCNHSVRYGANSGTNIDVTKLTSLSSTAAKRDTSVPVLHISADIVTSGVNNIEAPTCNTLMWNSSRNSVVSFGSEISAVDVYNAAGAKVASKAVNGHEVKLNLTTGIYIVKAMLADGTSVSLKVLVK